uniref:CSON010360 protein n=1 Tax=Culicoides sonorensis TaxID=179676 RepID=A0A336MZ32_CULSO
MLKKHRQTSFLIDKLHKGFVVTCIAATIYGLGVAGFRAYSYFTVTKPAREAEELRRLKLEEAMKDGKTLSG